MNGLRFEPFQLKRYSADSCGLVKSIHVVSKELCQASHEDLSSITKYASGKQINDDIRIAYWLARTFGNCEAISSCLLAALIELSKSGVKTVVTKDGITLLVKSARLQGYSVAQRMDSRNEISGTALDSRTHHEPGEWHTHRVVILSDKDGSDYVVDLAGIQFGIVGKDNTRPQIFIDEAGAWKRQFKECSESSRRPPAELSGKVDLLGKVARCVIQAHLSASRSQAN